MGEGAAAAFVHESRLENVLNFRDIGKTINLFTGRNLMVEGLLYRSARPDDATIADRRALREQHGIKTIIDFRTESERIKQTEKKNLESSQQDSSVPHEVAEHPLKIAGMNYLVINLNGRGFELGLVRKLSYFSFARMLCLMAFGYRIEAISILAREVMSPRGLIGLGIDTLDYCGAEIAKVLSDICDLLREVDKGPILFHCTQGKDRTGLIAALIELLLDIPVEAMIYDYCLSESELESEKETRQAEMQELGFSYEFLTCPKDWIPALREHLLGTYGGVSNYLSSIGFEREKQEALINVVSRKVGC